ncbi:hypothetical protein TRIATDRAFT_317064 [Trichoderma atroviride IMI 206040]|uniref:Nephrocystin 3-like N-terminal domain-containing protein n=1 Tax=Hypocrea atroviridis (strain ATCC 20476 / IMI 206040) TaxID=452589 RepID=G9NPW6_HYPAI|nr:uncharacterized protein TRIATDRAFT_317064 [Trichoderma atroviride IMI 206040]EHK47119.1 hypothetical protein TRIATDRAFT_317064 [Trichoderma atroviride IMI 206040]
MPDSAQGERVDRSSRLTALFKRKTKRHDRQDPSRPSSKAEASPARITTSSNPPATVQETYAAIKAGATSTTATGAFFATATGAVFATASFTTETPAESRTEIIDESVGSDLWSRAYQKLDRKTKNWIADASKKDSGEEKAQDLIKIIREREEVYKDATPKLKIGDQEILWRDYASRVVAWVTTIGDISINFAPAPSPVVWSAVKVLLKANVSQCEDLAAIFGCAEKVLRLIRHGKVYEQVYLSGGTYNTAAQNLQDALVDLYKALMELLAHASTRLNEGQGKQFLRALISGGEGAKLVSALADQEGKVSMAAQGCGAVASQEHQKLLQALDEPLRNVEDTVKKLLEKIEDGTLQQALDYISTIPIGEHQLEKQEARTPETCEWLLSHSIFLEWKDSRSSILWLQGNVGAGKSFLTSKVIEYILATRKRNAEHDEGFAYFYCSRSDPVRRETKHILRSYISQLARVPNHPTMMEKNVYALYLKAKNEKRGFSTDECEMALMELMNFYPRTTLILDALDECEMDTREALARILHKLVDKGEGTVKVFIASRKEADIEEYLGSQRLVQISTADNKDDIEKYIDMEIAKIGGAWRAVSAEVKEQVKKTIGEKSDGMFRWAYLQWAQLKKLRTNEHIIERLGKLPESLTEAYDEIYSKNEEKAVLKRAVKWVLCAREPLTSEVLLMAVRLESNLLSLTLSDPIDESILEDICSHLVVLDSQLRVWKFPHASVAEYFEDRHKSWVSKGPEDVAILLVSCLIDCYSTWTLPDSDDEVEKYLKMAPDLDNHLDARHPLQKYTRKYWLQHVQNAPNECQEATRLPEILKRFLGPQGPQQPSSRQYQAWCRHMWINRDLAYVYGYRWDFLPPEKSIFVICVFGLDKLLKGWWDKDIDVSQVNKEGLDLLAIAAKWGHDGLCSELIDRGSDIHRGLDSDYGSAFMEAIGRGRIKTARLLLDKGVDPNAMRNGKSPLCQAVHSNAEDLVEPLLEAGADPNITCSACSYGCALEAAAYWDRINSAEVLVKYGADVNLATEGNNYGSPLGTAAYQGSLGCAKLFVENGADVNAHLSGDYGSALAAAIFGEDDKMVKYLIEEAGADPAVLSSSPPRSPNIDSYSPFDRHEIARYLIDLGHVQESVLLAIGFPREDLPRMERTGDI